MGLTHGYRKQHLNVALTLGEKQRGGARLISHSGRADKKGRGRDSVYTAPVAIGLDCGGFISTAVVAYAPLSCVHPLLCRADTEGMKVLHYNVITAVYI